MKNNKKEIFIIIIATFFSVIVMMFNVNIRQDNRGYTNQNLQNDKEKYLNTDKVDNKNIEDLLLVEEDEQNFKDNNNENVDINIKEDEQENRVNEELLNSFYESVDTIEKSKLDNAKEKKSITENKEVTQSIFKIDKNSIIDKISNIDKLKIMKMANNLSVKDCKELVNNIKRNDELLAAMDIFRLLKNKLPHKEYTELIRILDPYIYIEVIENKIN